MNRSKQKGTAFETLIVDWLKENGHPYAHRNPPAGTKDVGDIGGIPGLVLELKNCQTMALAAWIREAEIEAAIAECPLFAVVHKRARHGNPKHQYVTMPLWVFNELIR